MPNAVSIPLFASCMILTAIVAVAILLIMFVGTCESSGMQLRYISDHLANCQDKASFEALPWILAVLLSIQFYGLLLIFRDLNHFLSMSFGWKDASLHCLTFHAIFMLFGVVEFRNDRYNKGQCVILDSTAGTFDFICDFFKSADEGDLHIWAAVSCLVEFSILHALLALKLYRKHVARICMFCTYVAVDTLYVVLVVMFVVFWLIQLSTAAQIFEWILLIIAGFLQILAIVNHASIQNCAKIQLQVENDAVLAGEEQRGLLSTSDTVHEANNQKHIKWMWTVLILYVCCNIISIIIIAPPSFSQPSISAQLYTQTSLQFCIFTVVAAALIWLDWYLWTRRTTQSH